MKSIRGAPKEYDMDDARLRSLEKILLTLEGKLMEGKILRVSRNVITLLVCMYYVYPQNCMVQIFDINHVDVSKNQLLSEMFFVSMRNIFVELESRLCTLQCCNVQCHSVHLCMCACTCVVWCVLRALCVCACLFVCMCFVCKVVHIDNKLKSTQICVTYSVSLYR